MYVFGFYSINEEDSNKRSFWPYSWGYFIIIGIFAIRAYLSTKFNEIKNIYFSEQTQKEKSNPEFNFILNTQENETNAESKETEFDDLSISIKSKLQTQRFKIKNKKKKKKVKNLIKQIKKREN